MAGERASDSGESGPSGGLDAELGQAVPSEKALAYVVLFVGENPQRIYPIKTSSVLLGRADEAQVSIADASVSSQHARIVQNSQGFEIVDLDSTNGTFVGESEPLERSCATPTRSRLATSSSCFSSIDRPVRPSGCPIGSSVRR